MSYARAGHERIYFKGISDSYVFTSGMPEDKDYYVEDYGDKYECNEDLIEVLANIIIRETQDNAYTLKIIRILAKRLDVYNNLKDEYKE
jgi:hypothetical protein